MDPASARPVAEDRVSPGRVLQLVYHRQWLELVHISVSIPRNCAPWNPLFPLLTKQFRYTQIHYWYRCAFPNWRDWTAKQTPKGVALQRMRRAVKICVLAGLVAGLVLLRRNQIQLVPSLLAGKNWVLAQLGLL